MEDGGSIRTFILAAILIVTVVFHMIYYGFFGSFETLNENSLERLQKEGNRRATALLQLMEHSMSCLHTLRFCLTGMGLFAGGSIFYVLDGIDAWIWFVIFWFVLVVFGIFVPNQYAVHKQERMALRYGHMICVIMIVLRPLVYLLEWISNLFLRMLRIDPKEDIDDVTEDEIISMVNEGHEHGLIEASEAEMIHNIFEFGDKEAKDIMTHRKNIIALDGNLTFGEALDFIKQNTNSRYPVYRDDIDDIIGVLHIKEALVYATDASMFDKTLSELKGLVREVDFIPETRNINELFKEMQTAKNHIVVVVDEYGQTSGIVTLEDIIEEVMGNILDEHDEDEELIKQQHDGSYLMSGMAEFEDVCKILDFPFNEKESFETLNGFLIAKIDKIPADDDKISVNAYGYCFKVLSIKNKVIQKIYVTKIPSKEEEKTMMQVSSCQKSE